MLLKVPECGCEKYVHRNPEIRNPKHTPQNGTCSVETFSRGPGQKIIGFTFYEPIKEEKEIGQAQHMFSQILQIRIYEFFSTKCFFNTCFDFFQMLKTEKKMPFLTNKEFSFSTEKKFVDSYSRYS